MINLLIITPIFPPDIGGPATYISNLIKNLHQNYNIKIITFAQMNEHSSKITKINSFQNPIIRQAKLFFEILKNLNNINVVYVQGTLTVGLATFLACKIKRKRYFLKFVGDEVWESYQNNGGSLLLEPFLTKTRNSIKFNLQKLILNNTQKIIVPSKYLKYLLKKYYQVNSINISNAIYISNNKIVKQKNTIIYVGRLNKWKNVDKLIQAFFKLPNNWKLIIVGDGPELTSLKKLSKKLNIELRINFYGKLTHQETSKLIANSEFLALLSEYEGLSHTLLEAMALKCKIIASNIKANLDLLQNGKFGLLVNQNNQQEIINSFFNKYNNTKINNAFNYVSKNYSWSNHINKLIKTFNE